MGGTGIPPFVPTDLPGLLAWHDASDAASVINTAGAVSQWSDKSGNANHWTQGTATNQPITGTVTLNGKNAIQFDMTNDRMQWPAGMFGIANATHYLFIVFQADTMADTRNILRGTLAGDANEKWGPTPWQGAILTLKSVSGGGYGANVLASNTNPYIFFMNNSALVTPYVNGAAGASTARVNTLLDQITLGGYSATNNAQAYGGKIAEVIAGTGNLTSSQANAAGGYLAAKWGITWTPIP